MYNKRLDYSWHQFILDCKNHSLYRYDNIDAILAITNGGFFFGAILAVKYKLPFYTITAKSYKDKKQGDLFIGEVPVQLSGTRILLVDDIADSGRTLKGVEKLLKENKVIVQNRLVLFKRQGLKCKCRYLHRVKKGIWVVFPWEK